VAQVVIENLYKSFPQRIGQKLAPGQEPTVNVLRAINLSIEDGEFMVLVGPSGCGKSTLLRLIAGLEEITAGNIFVGERLVNTIPPKNRDIAMVFQSYALYPHLTVYDNIAFGLRRSLAQPRSSLPRWLDQGLRGATGFLPPPLRYRSPQEQKVAQQVQRVAERLQIEGLFNRFPKQLSGGQKQRVALGRAIARNPQVFLMDEPLSNLDAKLRAETRSQIVTLQRQLGITTIYVTHDQTEAMTMGHRIAVMNQGVIQQLATPLELYREPANRFVAEFIGSPPMNFFSVVVESSTQLRHPSFSLALGEEWAPLVRPYAGRSLWLGVRSEHFSLAPQEQAHSLAVVVDLVEALGNDTYILAHLVSDPAVTLQARLSPELKVQVGDSLNLAMAPDKIHLFDYKTEQSLRAI
jgi:multiple sugar transport system ATP-binding protein